MINIDVDSMKDIVVKCECEGEMIRICSDTEFFEDESGGATKFRQGFWLAMYTFGTFHKKPSLWKRIKFAAYHLKTGKIHADQVILTTSEAMKLAEFIQENAVYAAHE